MKRRALTILVILALTVLPAKSNAQHFQGVLRVINEHCTSCHKSGGAAPFALETHRDISRRAGFILDLVEQKLMPPYPADTGFGRHANANALSGTDIEAIKAWIAAGKPPGKDEPRIDPANSARPSMMLRASQPYLVPGNNKEQFKIFVLPTHLNQDRYISAANFYTTAAGRTHHARIMVDTTGKLRSDHGISVGDSSEYQRSGIRLYDEFWKGWVPGNNVLHYPAGTGKRLPAGTDFIINTHYAASALEASDVYGIDLFFTDGKPEREVRTFIIDESYIVNKPFLIAPNSKPVFFARTEPLPEDISIISVLPHMHAAGKSFKAFAVSPNGIAIPLVHIPQWRFNWQLTYYFEHLQKVPKGSVIYVQAGYDNTTENHLVEDTSKAISPGWGTRNEMMNFIIEFIPYKQGDEKIRLTN